MRNVILVLGMHRSGTSAAAGSLVKLGGAQPKTLMPAEDGNERGYFESQALRTFHDELLASAGSDWTDWRQFNPAWYQSPTATAFQKRAKQLFKEEFDGEPLVVLKDPRVCRFAPFWLEVLAGIKARVCVIIPVRAPLEVAFSLRKRDGFSLATGALLWLRHIIDAEIATRALPRSIFSWDQLLGDWRSVAEKASTELGIPWPRLSDATEHEIENFVGYDLVHHRVSAPVLTAHPDIHEWTMSAYRAMLKLARSPQSSSALKTLDKTRDAFNCASRMFGRTVLEDEIRSQDLQRQHDAARAELAGDLQAKEQTSLELNALAREASDLAQALAEQGHQREQAELALAREKSLNAQLADAVAAAEKEFTAERERRDGLTARIAEADAELARERSQSESLKATLAATESKLAEELTRAQRAESEQASIAGKLRQKAAEADARAEDAGIKVLALEVKTAHLERDGERREREIAALLSSTSWQLSAPWRAYRWMVSRLRRLLHGKKMNPLFDREWYLEQYPDVRAGELDPYDHYLRHGAAEGRDPSPLFDTDWYLQQNLDVRESGANPLVHFFLHGASEGRDPHPLFSNDWYFKQHPLLKKQGTNALVHYLALMKQE
jgi:hypothetical protein